MEPTTTFDVNPKRPSGLNVLCILSFIMCGIVILAGLFGMISTMNMTPEKLQQSAEAMEKFSPGSGEMFANYDKNAELLKNGVGLALQFASLVGVIMMFRLKKMGFYIYVAAELLPYATGFLMAKDGTNAFTSMMGPLGDKFKSMIYVFIALVVIIDLLFIFLYSRHTKSMK
jgi:hypothetical protein